MQISNLWRRDYVESAVEPEYAQNTVQLQEVIDKYDLVGVSSGVVIVAERSGMEFAATSQKVSKTGELEKMVPNASDFREIGANGSSNYTSLGRTEYNTSLDGLFGLQAYDKMRRSDGQVTALLRLAKTPIQAARWFVSPGTNDDPTSPVDPINVEIAQFTSDCLFKLMSVSFPQFLTEALLHLDFGSYLFEKVFTYHQWRGETKIIWQKMAARHPMDVQKWNYDDTGGPSDVEFADPKGGGNNISIPISKLLVFTNDKEAGNMSGRSILRPAYKHWYYKENLLKIDAIQKERHGIGIPIIKLPANFNDTDRRLADEMGRNLRTNEKAHIVLPPMWEIMFAKMEGHQVDSLESAKYHDLQMVRSILGQFLDPESQGTSVTDQLDMFMKSARFVAESMRDAINKYAIPQLVDYNYPEAEVYPELRARRIGDQVDWRTLSFAIRNFVGAGIIVPDDRMEAYIRSEMDLPDADIATQRIIVAPQMPGTIPDGQPDGRPGKGGPAADAAHQNGQGQRAGAPNAAPAGPPRQSNSTESVQGKGPGRQLPPKS